ncbi:hypothetical protein SAMN05216349_11125 [Oribacterium sp. KHPX15]|uniref:hypothetical protein n=1 Tax=Oribacterium sp. KHPX15 TaxID=1855342 RepID=UPI00089836DF|nr:hypothetical protein [Oribacterium sp. KHPX15]SEA39025.1 hypothetical protein SAMN05216349_11125 [Oribacterium sp. KHPX15]
MEMEMRDEDEIDLLQLCFLCLRKWKTILLAGVVLALALGGYKGARELSKVGTEVAVEAEETAEEKVTQYDATLASYKAQFDRLSETFEKNQVYEQESIIMNMNPNNYFSGSSTYYISTDYKIMPDMTYQDVDYSADIAQAYLSYLTSSECLAYVQSKLTEKISAKYLSELIRVNVTGRVLNVKVVGDTSGRTTEILNAISEAIDNYKKEVDTKIHEHKLDLMEYSEVENTSSTDGSESGSGNDNYVADVQKQFSDSQINLTNQISTFYDKYTKLADTKVSTDSSGSGITKSQAVKSGVKFGIIGLILGFFVAAGFIVFKAIIEDKIVNAGEISYLFGLRIFGDYKSGAGSGAFDKLLYKLSYGDALPDKEKFYEVAAANVKTFATAFKDEDIKDISLIGRIDSEALQSIVKSINDINGDDTVKLAGDIITDASAINAIRDAKYTLIAVDRTTSKKDLRTQLEKLKGLKKHVAGVLLFD